MNLSKISIRRPVTIIMVILAICLIGSVSLSKLKVDLLPNLNMPIAVVTAKYTGAGPREIESLITKPFEGVLTTVSNLKSIETVSTNEYSLCILYFNDNTDMNFATLEMREKIDLVKTYLPKGVQDIMVMRIDPNNFKSTVELGISSNMTLEDLTRLVEDQIINKLERISGIASVSISGGETQEVRIELIPEKLTAYGFNEISISQYLALENLNIPAGNIETSGMSIFLRTNGEFTSIEEIKNLAIPTATGSIVLIKDFANVSLTKKVKTSESFINGKLSLNISVQKQSNANAVQVCKAVRDEISSLKKAYPDINFSILYDASNYINLALQSVTESAIQGGILAALILYLFLRNLRATLIIAVSMPVSVVTTFVLMYFSGINLNLISLAGLALGVGMLVDNSIVVLENIYRYRHEGKSLTEAAEIGAKEVMLAISASTLTTIVVFIPIVFVEGLTGKVFKDMGLTITFSLLASLIIAITFIPMMASKLLSIEFVRTNAKRRSLGTRIFDAWENFYNRVCVLYEKMLKACIRRRIAVILIALVLFILSLFSLPLVGLEYFPSMDEGLIAVEVMMPKGSALSETHDMAFKVQERIRKIPEVQEIYMTIGNGGFVLDRSTTEKATLSVNVGSIEKRGRSINQISDSIRKNVADLPGAKITIADDSKVMGFSIGSNEVDIRVSGEDLQELKKISKDIVDIVSGVKGIRDAESSIDQEIEEASIKIDRNKAILYGLTTAQVGQAIQTQVNGIVATRYKYRGSEIDLVVCTLGGQAKSIQDIYNISVQSPRGISIPLSDLATIALEKSPPSILRNDQKRTVSITAQINGRAMNKITNDIDKALSSYKFPSGYAYTYGGQQKDLFDSFDALKEALILSIFIVYMLLASQFESLIQPVTILMTAPLALTGALFSLLLTGNTLSIPAFIGIIILVGIVVDNAIVLIDSVNRYREEGLSQEDAIIKAGPQRLRPILMTTLTTILGMLPMAITRKEGSEILSPLAVVVIGGLTISTLVTLIVIPSFYMVFENLQNRTKVRMQKRIKT